MIKKNYFLEGEYIMVANAVQIVTAFIINFILDYYFWMFMVGLGEVSGYLQQMTPDDEMGLIVKLTLASILIPAIIFRTGLFTWLLLLPEGSHKPDSNEAIPVNIALNDICRHANLNPKDYSLYINNRDELNAFAYGHTISVMRVLLYNTSREQLTGIMAHEMGHIQYGHANACLFINGMSWFTHVVIFVFNALALICRILAIIPFLGLLLNIFMSIVFLIYGILSRLLDIPNHLVYIFGSRSQEDQADAYAVEIGLGRELADGLQHLDDLCGNSKPGFFARHFSDHPDTNYRINRILRLVEEKEKKEGTLRQIDVPSDNNCPF